MTAGAALPHPGVRFPPPLLFAGGLLIGGALDRWVRALPISRAAGAGTRPLGIVLVVLGVGLVAWGMLTFRRARTAIVPHHPASRIVSVGPYRYTRNPMYTGLTIVSAGAAGLMDSAWPLLLLPLVLAALVRLVIVREEAYLHSAFGAEYAAYQARVGRWG